MITRFGYLGLACIILLWTSGCKNAVSTNETNAILTPPNIILMIADDMAWNDCGAYGHPHIQTPNLDQLAREGMRMDQAFLTTSSCSPSRSSIITGLYPHLTDAEQLHWPLPADQLTFVELLKEAGYWTAQAGKWHLGDAVKNRFDLVRAGGTEVDKAARPRDGSGCEDWVQTLQDRPEGQPFFLWLAAIDPHRGYQEGIIDNPHQQEDVVVPPYMPDNAAVREDFTLYYNEITRLDTYVGRVMEALEDEGIADNTFIVFISDNGRPFPRDKTTLYDGGIKTPWIMRWPKTIQPGTISDQLVSSVDLAPTFLSLAQVDIPSHMNGHDLSPLLANPDTTIRAYVYAEDHWHDFDDFTRAARNTQFKYIRNFYPELANTPPADALRGGTFIAMRALLEEGDLNEAQRRIFEAPRPEEELYDIQADPYELNNLAKDPNHEQALTEMRNLMDSIRTSTQDTLPAERTPDEFDRATGEKLPNWAMPRKPQ